MFFLQQKHNKSEESLEIARILPSPIWVGHPYPSTLIGNSQMSTDDRSFFL